MYTLYRHTREMEQMTELMKGTQENMDTNHKEMKEDIKTDEAEMKAN
jgi:hypothetical protein